MHFNLITCDDKIGIASTLQSYVLNLNYRYLLLPRMDRTEAMVRELFTGAALETPSGRKIEVLILAKRTKGQIQNMVKYQLW